MIVVPPTVEPHQTEFHQFLNLCRSRVNHADYRFSLTLDLPVYEEEIREHLHIVENQFRIFISHPRRSLLRLELHLIHELDTVISLVCAVSGKSKNAITHVRDIIFQVACIGVLQNFINEIDTRLSPRMNLLIEIPHNQRPKSFLALYCIKIYHFFSFHRQPGANRSNRQIITFG